MQTLSTSMKREAALTLKALLWLALIALLFLACQNAYASDGAEFEEATGKLEGWVKGNLGKLAALVCLAIGMFAAAVRKDWTFFFGSIVIALFISIIVGIINASFTATIALSAAVGVLA